MTESIDDLLQRIDNYKRDFYPRAIELHEDAKLRKLVKEYATYDLELIPCEEKSYPSKHGLNYGSSGFYLRTYEPTDGYGSDYGSYKFQVKNGKLICGNKELLEYFPKLSISSAIESIEEKLKDKIMDLDIYKKASRGAK